MLDPASSSATEIRVSVNGTELTLATNPELFSPRRADRGTLAMLSAVELQTDDHVLDLGCGYGLVGIYAAKTIGQDRVTMVDVDPLAVQVASLNAARNGVPQIATSVSDGFRDLDQTGFTKILSNPPYHTDFSVAKHFILKGFNRLSIGGELWFVTRREKWYREKLRSVFGGVQVQKIDGYTVLRAQKRSDSYAKRG
jgi:16S rRNA (guanine1207-N2)-methyltransferase